MNDDHEDLKSKVPPGWPDMEEENRKLTKKLHPPMNVPIGSLQELCCKLAIEQGSISFEGDNVVYKFPMSNPPSKLRFTADITITVEFEAPDQEAALSYLKMSRVTLHSPDKKIQTVSINHYLKGEIKPDDL